MAKGITAKKLGWRIFIGAELLAGESFISKLLKSAVMTDNLSTAIEVSCATNEAPSVWYVEATERAVDYMKTLPWIIKVMPIGQQLDFTVHINDGFKDDSLPIVSANIRAMLAEHLLGSEVKSEFKIINKTMAVKCTVRAAEFISKLTCVAKVVLNVKEG